MVTDPPIQLPRHLVQQLLHLAQCSPERESAALVGARAGQPRTSYPVSQAGSTLPEESTLNPRDPAAALAALHSNGETLFAVFISHPRMPASPTPGEIESRDWAAVPRLIASLNTRGVLELRAYRLIAGQAAAEVALEMVE